MVSLTTRVSVIFTARGFQPCPTPPILACKPSRRGLFQHSAQASPAINLTHRFTFSKPSVVVQFHRHFFPPFPSTPTPPAHPHQLPSPFRNVWEELDGVLTVGGAKWVEERAGTQVLGRGVWGRGEGGLFSPFFNIHAPISAHTLAFPSPLQEAKSINVFLNLGLQQVCAKLYTT